MELPWWDLYKHIRLNIREYYWDYSMKKVPVFVEDYFIYFGLRAGFRL